MNNPSPSALNPTSLRNMLVVVGYGSAEAETISDWDSLASALSQRLKVPVQPAFLDRATPSIGEGIQRAVAEHHPQRVIVLPLFLGASAAKKANVTDIITAANDLRVEVTVHEAKPLGNHQGVVAAYKQLIDDTLRIGKSDATADETALLIIGRGSRDPESNADTYTMARLLWEEFRFGSLEVGFYGSTRPDIASGIKRCVQSGAKRIVVVPYLLYDAALHRLILDRVQHNQSQYPGIEFETTAHLGVHEGILDAASQRHQETLTELAMARCDFCPLSEDEDNTLRYLFAHAHEPGSAHSHNYGAASNPYMGNLQALLPRYQSDTVVSPAPMGAADLKIDDEGRVAWDEIWGDFCDLALAGGPPHRGTLLEPVTPEAVRADPDGYQRVLAELERGIRMVTKLPVVTSQSPGWIGLQCGSEEMALWLLRAIVVENISVRREDAVLYLPAGPGFRLEKEIKNVVTVVAKTYHYWTEHITSKQ